MDWFLILSIVLVAPIANQRHTHWIPLFPSEKLCVEAADLLKKNLEGPSPDGGSVTVLAACRQRKDLKDLK